MRRMLAARATPGEDLKFGESSASRRITSSGLAMYQTATRGADGKPFGAVRSLVSPTSYSAAQ